MNVRCAARLVSPDLSRARSDTCHLAVTEPGDRRPVACVGAARLRSDQRREAPGVRGDSGTRVRGEDRHVLARVVADPEPHEDGRADEAGREDRDRRPLVLDRHAATTAVSAELADAVPLAFLAVTITRSRLPSDAERDGVALPRCTGDVGARRGIGGAPLPGEGVAGRPVRPLALAATSVWPTLARPVIVGGAVFAGAVPTTVRRHGAGLLRLGRRGAVGVRRRNADPDRLLLVRCDEHVRLRRGGRDRRAVLSVARQRSHRYANDVGALAHVPSLAVSVSPTFGVPEIFGRARCLPERQRPQPIPCRLRSRSRAVPRLQAAICRRIVLLEDGHRCSFHSCHPLPPGHAVRHDSLWHTANRCLHGYVDEVSSDAYSLCQCSSGSSA